MDTAVGTTSRILVADDDRVASQLLRLLLGGAAGHEVVCVENGDEVLAAAVGLSPDLVLLDVQMPGLDGYDVCRQIRADARLAEVPILMITALSDREARLRGLDAGADDFISKPFDRTELVARIRTITRLNRHRHLQEGRRLAQQVEMAAAIQQQLLPRGVPEIEGLEIHSCYRPATRVGGDYYDLVVDHGSLYVVAADVSGHGLASALFMSNVRSAVRSLLPYTPELVELVASVNRRMCEDSGDSGMFVSAVVGRYAPADGRLTIANCGHPEPILVCPDGTARRIAASAPPIGMVDDLGVETCDVDLGPGDLVCLYTDGLIEAASASGEMFGPSRMAGVLAGCAGAGLDTVVRTVLDAVSAFTATTALDDDVTLVLLRRTDGPR